VKRVLALGKAAITTSEFQHQRWTARTGSTHRVTSCVAQPPQEPLDASHCGIIPLSFDAGRPLPVDPENLADPLLYPFIFDCDGNIVPQPYRLALPGRHPVEPVGAEDPADPPLDPFVFDSDGYINIVPQNRNVRQ
jgi:hypothetical protein